MDYSLETFSKFLYENKEDAELTAILKNNMNENSRAAVRYVKEKYLQEVSSADWLKDNWDRLTRESAEKIIKRREDLEKALADNKFDPNEAVEIALDIVSIESSLPFSPLVKKELKKELRDVLKEPDETRKKRIAKILAFRAIKLVDDAKAELIKQSKEEPGATRAIETKEGKTILQSMKGKNDNKFTRGEVKKTVEQEARAAQQEIDSVDKMTENPARAKLYAEMIYKDFRNSNFEGTLKDNQFVAKYNELMKRKDAIIAANKKPDIGADSITQKERDDWEALNLYTIMNDLRNFGMGKSELTAEQIKKAIVKLKKAGYDAMELINQHLTKE